MEQMAGMKTPFKEDGVVSVAVSSPLTAGAAALLLMSRDKADELGLDYHIKYAGGAMAGCDPTVMGVGPIYAAQKMLKRAGLTVKDIDVWELNEAFGSQALACLRELEIAQNAPFENVNVWGGALALGHPLGMSGARLVTSAFHQMQNQDKKYALCTMCIGVGQGISMVLEKV